MIQYIKKNWLLLLLALCGIILYKIYYPTVFSLDSIDVTWSRSEISQKADDFFKSQQLDASKFKKTIIFRQNERVIRYLQTTLGIEDANKLIKEEPEQINYWFVQYYQDIERNIPREGFEVFLSMDGNILGFNHWVPDTTSGASIELEEAFERCQNFLVNKIGLDTTDYVLEKSSSKNFRSRKDHYFIWEGRDPKFLDAKIKINMSVTGDRVSGYNRNIEIPQSELESYNEYDTQRSFLNVITYLISFLILIFISVAFLRKYHQGEIGVRHGFYFFLLIIVLGILFTTLNIKLWSQYTHIGAMRRSHVMWFLFIIFIIFVDLFRALTVFTGWSAGESYAREFWPDKMSAIDGILKRKIFTLNTARSVINGYFASFIVVGYIVLFSYIGLTYINGWSTASFALSYIDRPFPFLTPIVGALLIAFSQEIVYRQFFISYFRQVTKSVPVSILLAALVLTLQEPMVSIEPISLNFFQILGLGLILGALYVRYDLLTTIMSTAMSLLILNGISLYYLDHSIYRCYAVIITIFMCAPLIIAIVGFIRRQYFTYRGNELPPHIRRISERARMSKELEIARKVQLSLLPKKNPIIPGFEIHSLCIPAQEVGGDYYDFVRLEQNKIGIAIGDVSGKGIPAAIYMTLTKGILQSYAEENISPKKVLSKVNKLMYQSIERDSFVSMFYAILDAGSRTLTFSRAGHNPAIFYKENQQNYMLLQPEGIGLGLESGTVFDRTLAEETLELNVNDLLIFYTDGFTEAMNRRQEEYGEDRLLKIIRENHHLPASQVVALILIDIKHFTKGFPQHDDMTMVAIKVI